MAHRKIILLTLLSLVLGGVATGGGIWLFSLSPSFPFFSHSRQRLPVSSSIGMVDINGIKANSKVFQKFTKDLDNLNATIYREILEQETQLRAEYEQFKKREEETREPTPEILKQKAELDKKSAGLEKVAQERKEELDRRYTEGLTHIKETLKDIVKDLGKTHGLTLILNKSIGEDNQMDQSIVLFCDEGLDLTQEVILRLDKKLLPRNMKEEKEAKS